MSCHDVKTVGQVGIHKVVQFWEQYYPLPKWWKGRSTEKTDRWSMAVVVSSQGLAWLLLEQVLVLYWCNSWQQQQNEVSDVYRNILFANLLRNASNLIGRNFIMQQDNHLKTLCQKNKALNPEGNKILDWTSQSPDFNPIEQYFISWREDWMGKTPQNKQNWKKLQK